MPKPKRKNIESLQTRVFIHYFCLQAQIKVNSVELSLLVENTKKSSSKYARFISGKKTPSPSTVNLMMRCLSELSISKSKVDELRLLFSSPLWQVLDNPKLSHLTIDNFYSKLDRTILASVTHEGAFTPSLRYRLDWRSVQKIEREGTLNALACLLALLIEEAKDDNHLLPTTISWSTFRLLISFFQHPSFYYFRNEIWTLITLEVVPQEDTIRDRLGIGFWNLSKDQLTNMINKDSELLNLARTAKIIKGTQDDNLFLFCFYQSKYQKAAREQLIAINLNQKVHFMTDLNAFINELNAYRPKSRQTEFASETHKQLVNHELPTILLHNH